MSVDEQSPQDEQEVQSLEDDGKTYQERLQDKEWDDFLAKQEGEEESPEETDEPDDDQDDSDTSTEIGDDPGVPDVIMQQARDLGFSDQDVQALGEQRIVDFISQRNKQMLEAEQQRLQQQAEPEQPVEAEKPSGDFQFEEIKLENPDEFDDAVVGLVGQFNTKLKSMAEQLHKAQQMESQFTQWQQSQQQQQAMETTRLFDQKFKEVEEKYGDFLGKGTFDQVSQEDFEKRQKIVNGVMTFAQSSPELPFDQAFEMSLLANYSDVISERKAEQLRGEIRGQSRKRVGSPAGKRKPERPDIGSLPPDHPDVARFFERKWANEI